MKTKVTEDDIFNLFKIKPVYTFKELSNHFSCTYPCLWMHMHKLNYYTSFTHNSRFYALEERLDFDQDGICFIDLPEVGAVGFTKHGSAKALIISSVDSSNQGMFDREIRDILKIRISNQLNVLTGEGKIRKEKIDGLYKYYSSDEKIYKAQKTDIETDKQDNFNVREGSEHIIATGTQPNESLKNSHECETRLKQVSESRDKWRERSNTYRKSIKLLTLKIRDLTKSRNHWKQSAKENKKQNNKLESELQDIKKNSRS
jgi:hypothetical protein